VEASAVPALAYDAASSVSAEDIAIPTIYMGQRAQSLVEAGFAKPGDIYSAQSQDDSDAQVLWEYGSKDEGVLIIPLHLRKSWSFSPGAGMQLEIWPFEARGRDYPDGPPLDDPDPKKRAWLTYNYTLLVPEVDPQMPYRTRFYRSGVPAAQKINFEQAKDPGHLHAFRWVTTERSRQGVGKWYIPQLVNAEATAEQFASAVSLLNQLAPDLNRRSTVADDAPGI
jgi:hypothetical protein